MTLFKKKSEKYRFALISLRPSLTRGDREPFAVVLAGEPIVVVVGRYPESWDELSEVGKEVMNEISDTLTELISGARAQELDVFEHLAELREKYEGKIIGITAGQVILVSDNPSDFYRERREKGIKVRFAGRAASNPGIPLRSTQSGP